MLKLPAEVPQPKYPSYPSQSKTQPEIARTSKPETQRRRENRGRKRKVEGDEWRSRLGE